MLEVNKLSFHYEQGTRPAVDGIDFRIGPGEIFGFLGPNGAGKSTTQKVLIKLLKAYQGEVKVLGRDLASWGRDYYQKVGVCFEKPNNYQKLTALENLSLFRSLYGDNTEDPVRLLEMVDLKDDANTLVGNFSKGMQMRLNFARSLLNKPELIFLDEPTSGLDPVSSRKIRDLILEQKHLGHTIFLTTHNMFIADELCDRVAFIVDGKIVLEDSPGKMKIERGQHVVTIGYREGQETREIDFPLPGLGDNSAFLEILKTKEISTMHTREPGLEDIFIQVTGRQLL
ncbi:abc transporter, atp-binding protein [hydrocarbon metagenome]|uniref:Abc transporter, atp-binding protein n=1 Tax=hydrocarbon metagenome TaxID=938273 RepID=A0A0W8E175_9ZZZZ